MADKSMPWESGAADGKYRYHPGGNPSSEPRDAPSAVNVVIVPDVNLPKVRKKQMEGQRPNDSLADTGGLAQELHDKWNKWGKDGY